jgi:hypothetical protein
MTRSWADHFGQPRDLASSEARKFLPALEKDTTDA